MAAKLQRLRLIPVLVAALAALASAAGAELLWSGLDNGLWRIYTNAGGGAALSLQGPPPESDHNAPSLSPDGSRVAIEVAGAGVWICTMKTLACERLSGLPGVAARPAWNPKTGELVFAMFTFDGGREDSDLWVADPELENPRPLIVQTGNQDNPDFSPDGRTLVYDSGQTVFLRRAATRVVRHIWLMDLVTGRARPLAPGATQDIHPDWSPDGKRIAFASDRSGRFEIWVSGVDGGEPRRVTSGEGSKSWPAWSPDGRSILFTRLLDGRSSLAEIGTAAGSEMRTFAPSALPADAQMRDPDWR